MDVLCMAGEETTATVQRVAAATQLAVRVVLTTAEALQLLREQEQQQNQTGAPVRGGCRALVAALGVEPSNFLFNEGYADRSDLVAQAKRLGCVVVVYSYTAVKDGDTSRACMDVGVDAVVASAADLQQQVAIFDATDAIEAADRRHSIPAQAGAAPGSPSTSAPVEPVLRTLAPKDAQAPAGARRAFPRLPAGAADNRAELSYYPPLLRRAHRDETLLSLLAGERHQAANVICAQTESISRMLAGLPRPLLAPSSAEASGSGQEFARVVAISDTHSYHDDNMHLPRAMCSSTLAILLETTARATTSSVTCGRLCHGCKGSHPVTSMSCSLLATTTRCSIASVGIDSTRQCVACSFPICRPMSPTLKMTAAT